MASAPPSARTSLQAGVGRIEIGKTRTFASLTWLKGYGRAVSSGDNATSACIRRRLQGRDGRASASQQPCEPVPAAGGACCRIGEADHGDAWISVEVPRQVGCIERFIAASCSAVGR